jgi:hypothetical protein
MFLKCCCESGVAFVQRYEGWAMSKQGLGAGSIQWEWVKHHEIRDNFADEVTVRQEYKTDRSRDTMRDLLMIRRRVKTEVVISIDYIHLSNESSRSLTIKSQYSLPQNPKSILDMNTVVAKEMS